MPISRRTIIAAGTVGAAAGATASSAQAAPVLGSTPQVWACRPNAPQDQTEALQRAIDRAAQARTTLILPAGTYRAAELRLPPHAKIAGTRGATRLSLAHARSLFVSERAENIDLVRPGHRRLEGQAGGRPRARAHRAGQRHPDHRLHHRQCRAQRGDAGALLRRRDRLHHRGCGRRRAVCTRLPPGFASPAT